VNINKMMANVMPLDKQLHMLWLFMATSCLLVFVPMLIACVIGLSVAIVKEFFDNNNTAMEHVKDVITGALGVGLAALVSVL